MPHSLPDVTSSQLPALYQLSQVCKPSLTTGETGRAAEHNSHKRRASDSGVFEATCCSKTAWWHRHLPRKWAKVRRFPCRQVHLNTDLRVGLALQPKKTGRRAIGNKACQDSYQPLAVYALQTDESWILAVHGPVGSTPEIVGFAPQRPMPGYSRWDAASNDTHSWHVVPVEVSNYLICATWALRWFELNRQRYATCLHLSSLIAWEHSTAGYGPPQPHTSS